jgi:hypothetical protein
MSIDPAWWWREAHNVVVELPVQVEAVRHGRAGHGGAEGEEGLRRPAA